MRELDKDEYKEFLDDICSEYCEVGHYCILKEFLISAHTSHRLLLQLKCIDRYKFFESKKEDKDIGWTESVERWVKNGWAERFGRFYEETMRFKTLYKKIMDKTIP